MVSIWPADFNFHSTLYCAQYMHAGSTPSRYSINARRVNKLKSRPQRLFRNLRNYLLKIMRTTVWLNIEENSHHEAWSFLKYCFKPRSVTGAFTTKLGAVVVVHLGSNITHVPHPQGRKKRNEGNEFLARGDQYQEAFHEISRMSAVQVHSLGNIDIIYLV